jgi:hypothetical protein
LDELKDFVIPSEAKALFPDGISSAAEATHPTQDDFESGYRAATQIPTFPPAI